MLGADHPDSLATRLNLSVFLLQQGRAGEAVEGLRDLVSDCERVIGASGVETAIARATLGEALAALGGAEHVVEAKGHLVRAVADLRAVFGEGSEAVRRAEGALAEIGGGG